MMTLEAQEQAAKQPSWRDTVSVVTSCTVKPEYDGPGDATLHVELYTPGEDELEKIRNEKGKVTGYKRDGVQLPPRYWPGQTLIRKFELEWDGQKIEIPARFWADLAGFQIQQSSLKLGDVPNEQRYAATRFLQHLDKPRIRVSADEGTVLIEWGRPEECDSHSTIRWIVSKSGTVLRHRTTPPHP